MYHFRFLISTFIILIIIQCKSPSHVNYATDSLHELLQRTVPDQKLPSTVSRIAFGSCQSQDGSLLTLDIVLQQNPDLFIYLGDNIYGDTENMKILAAKYSKLGARPEFMALTKACPVLATWDDHDYGANDAGREYKFKAQSKELFLSFWNDPEEEQRRSHEGIYASYIIGDLQLILLDTRSFRSPLLKAGSDPNYRNSYRPNDSKSATILGEAQWNWLEQQFAQPAKLRLIGSSTQFGIEYNGYEAWANFPNEQQRMLQLIKKTKANSVVFLSGDVHYGELSKLESEDLYPIYDCTSSGINKDWPHIEPNKNRVGKGCRHFNFGMLEIDWEKELLTFKIITAYNKVHLEQEIDFGKMVLDE